MKTVQPSVRPGGTKVLASSSGSRATSAGAAGATGAGAIVGGDTSLVLGRSQVPSGQSDMQTVARGGGGRRVDSWDDALESLCGLDGKPPAVGEILSKILVGQGLSDGRESLFCGRRRKASSTQVASFRERAIAK